MLCLRRTLQTDFCHCPPALLRDRRQSAKGLALRKLVPLDKNDVGLLWKSWRLILPTLSTD